MESLFVNVKKLYDCELYENVLPLASLIHTIQENGGSLLTPEQELQLLLFEADALYQIRKFRNAESCFQQAMLYKKNMLKEKSFLSTTVEGSPYVQFSDSEIKYKIAVCLLEIHKPTDALAILQSVPSKQRSPKINLMLARLQSNTANSSNAKKAFKDVLRDCPLNLEAIRGLVDLGIDGVDVNALIITTSSSSQCASWLSTWIRGHDYMYQKKFDQAIETFKTMNETSLIRNNELLLVLIGECMNYNGYYDSALRYLMQAHAKKPNMTEGLMTLAVLYSKKNKYHELEALTVSPPLVSEFSSENWFVLAQSLFANGKFQRAICSVQKSLFENPKNVEALLLKAKIFIALNKHREALPNLYSARELAPYRFDVYKILVDCYLRTNQLAQAQQTARHALHTLGSTPRNLVLLAQTFFKDPSYNKNLKNFLHQALQIDEYYTPAVALLAVILQKEGDTQGALQLLKKNVSARPNCKLHSLIGDILTLEKDLEGAIENYTIALNLDPTNARALAALNGIGQSPRSANKAGVSNIVAATADVQSVDYEEDIVEISTAVANADAESESGSPWSDMEVEMYTQ